MAAHPPMADPSGPAGSASSPHAHLWRSAVAELTAYTPSTGEQARLREDYLAHLARHADGVVKTGPPAHLTASCLVLDESLDRVLLTHHRRARRWFQFGGHLETTDPGLWAAAAREGREESGIATLAPGPAIIELNRHRLEGDFGRCREHLDVRYAALVPVGSRPQVSGESLDVQWWPVDALPEGPQGEVADLVRAARSALG